VIIIQYM